MTISELVSTTRDLTSAIRTAAWVPSTSTLAVLPTLFSVSVALLPAVSRRVAPLADRQPSFRGCLTREEARGRFIPGSYYALSLFPRA